MGKFETAKGFSSSRKSVAQMPIYETNMRNFSIANQVAFRRISMINICRRSERI